MGAVIARQSRHPTVLFEESGFLAAANAGFRMLGYAARRWLLSKQLGKLVFGNLLLTTHLKLTLFEILRVAVISAIPGNFGR